MSKSLIKSATAVMSMTMVSRIFGFIRDMVTAIFFGAGPAFDAFSVAFKIPNFMRRLFAEGSFSQAFVPILSSYQKQNTAQDLRKFLDAMAGTLGIALIVVTVFGVIGAPWIVRVFAPGFEVGGDRYDLAVTMLRITFPYLFFISLTAFSGAILNTHSRFWVAAFTPVLLNLTLITATIFISPELHYPIMALAWGVFAAGLVQLLFQLPFLHRLHLFPRPRIDWSDPGVRRVLKLMVPALFGVSVGQVNLLVDTLFASLLVVGSVTWLYYSDRLMEFPLGVFGVAISTVILPHLSRHHASEAKESYALTLDWAMRMVLLVGIPAAVVLALMAGPLLSTLIQHGKFSAHATLMAQQSLTAFAIGIAPFMMVKILAAGFYAKQDMKTPVKIAVVAMVANIVFNMILIWPLAHAGIALSTSLAAVINSSLLFYFLYQKKYYVPQSGWALFATRLAIANVVLMLWIYWTNAPTQTWVTAPTLWRVEHLAGILIGSVAVYLTSLWVTGIRPHHFIISEQLRSWT